MSACVELEHVIFHHKSYSGVEHFELGHRSSVGYFREWVWLEHVILNYN